MKSATKQGRCVNCAVRFQRNVSRHLLSETIPALQQLACVWISRDLHSLDEVCGKCLLILQESIQTANSVRKFGYRNICIPCGSSILRVNQTHAVPVDSAEGKIILQWIPSYQVDCLKNVCMPCWLRASRAVYRQRKQNDFENMDLQPMDVEDSSNVPQQTPLPAPDETPDGTSMYCDEDDTSSFARDAQSKDYETVFDSFRCSVCDSVITEFRYTCVQCNDFDLCSACEINRAHHHHYVLRVPAQRPFAEIQYVLSTIRRHLMKRLDPITNCDHDGDDDFSVKSEIKVEVENDDYDNNGDVEDNGDEDNDGSEDSDVDNDDNDNDDNIESDDNRDDSEANDKQEPKSNTCDETASRSEIAPPDNKHLETPDFAIDISIKEEPDSESHEVEHHPPSTDAVQMAPASSTPKHQMIVIKRANIVNVEDGSPSAKKICVMMSNPPRGSEGKVTRVMSFNPVVRPQKPETGQEAHLNNAEGENS